MKNSFEQKIVEQLKKLDQQINQFGNRLTNLENTEHTASNSSHNDTKNSSTVRSIALALVKYGTLIVLSLISLIVGYWFLRSWHSTLYQIMLLIYSLGIIAAGFIKKNKAIRILGYSIYACTLFLMVISYKCNHLLHPQTSLALHSLFAALLIFMIWIMK